MRTSRVALLRFELIRAFTSSRWVTGVLVWLLVAKLGSEAVETAKYGAGTVDWSVFDVHAAAINSNFNLGLLLLSAFVLIAGDGIGRDRESRFVHITVPRAGDKRTWWSTKMAVLLASALVFQAGFLVACCAVGWYDGAELSTAPSAFAQADFRVEDGEPRVLFAPVAAGEDMLMRELSRSAYLALAFFAVGAICVLPSLRYSSAWLPAGLSLGYVMADWVAVNVLPEWYLHAGLIGRMLEGAHSPAMASPVLSWVVSIVVFSSLGVAAYLCGRVAVTRVDL